MSAATEKQKVEPSAEEQAQQRRLASRRMHSLIGAMLVTLIVFEVNYLSYRHFERFDWTQDARFTLSERTEEVLRGLEADVRIVLLLSDAEPNFEDVRELIERYRAESTRVQVEFVDPDKDPGAARRAAELYDIELGVASTGESFADVAAVVVSGSQRWKITRDDLFEIDFDAMDESDGPKVDVKAERALTGAIVQVTEGEATRICLTSGRGEWSLSGERSLYVLREELERENLEVEDLPAVGLREVPERCDSVFVLGPQRAFASEEARVLIDWVKSGGNLVLALDPVLNRSEVEPTGFESAAEDLGVLIDRTVLLEMDPRYVLRGDPSDLIRVLNFGEHETTGPLRMTGGGIAMALLRSVRPTEGSTATTLLLSSENAYAETDIGGLIADRDVEADPDDLTGPISLAVAVEANLGAAEDARPGRLVVIGDSDWLEPTFLVEPQFGNLDLLMSITGYATQRDALIAIPPHRSNLQAVVMSEADVGGVALRIFGLLPLAILLLGVAVWWSRRQ